MYYYIVAEFDPDETGPVELHGMDLSVALSSVALDSSARTIRFTISSGTDPIDYGTLYLSEPYGYYSWEISFPGSALEGGNNLL